MFTLRPYQEEAVASIIESLQAGLNPICNLPTGSGKSLVLAELCNRLDGRILVVTHRKELIQQNEATLHRNGGDSIGAYSAGLGRRDIDSRIIVAGVASIYKRMNELQNAGPFRYVLYDEVHYGTSNQCGNTMGDQVLRACPTAQRVGLSATPYRLPDIPIWGKDMWFDEVAVEESILELTNAGYLCRLVGVQTAAVPKLDHVRTRGGDFALGDLSQASSEEAVVNAACDEILYLAQDRKHILIFCVDVAHAGVVCEAMRERGCDPVLVTGTTPGAERSALLARFKSGEVRYLANVGVLTTGFDSPNVDAIVLMRATQSRSLLIQMLGRGSRLHPSKQNCIILDCGGNLARHAPIDGLPKVLRSPQLAEEQEKEERKRRERAERERKVRHEARVAVGIDPLASEVLDDAAITLRITKATYSLRPAKKFPDRENLLVSYRGVTSWGAERSAVQFVLLDYPGRPGVEAAAWFARRGLEKPQEPRQALAMAWTAPVPGAIVVQKVDGWDRVLMEQFEEGGE